MTDRTGDPRFHALIDEIRDLHDAKQADYGRDEDAFANVRAAIDFGVPGWVGAMIRCNDKMRRVQTYIQKGQLVNDSVYDDFKDMAVYCLIAHILLEEEEGE